MEEDLNVLDEEQVNGGKAGRKGIPQTSKAAGKQRGAEEKRKEAQRDGEGKEEEEKKKRRSAVRTSAARPEKNQLVKKGKKRKSRMSSLTLVALSRDKRVLSSEEEDEGEERSWVRTNSWMPESNDGQVVSFGQKQKVFIGETASTDKQRKRQRGGQGGTQLEVVLEAFLDFCDQYRGERQVCLLQKEKSELKARLADLRRGQAFLHDIRELNTQYLDYRHKHPKEKEMYGASSLPALLLEAKCSGRRTSAKRKQ
ncbi:hypothetical protein F7725_009700 [Dissostichus mawsoni]|uniref:Uncharacterized protein n=1 Tax=Dissostichus mawsoni TaxID=36200 RepID=A0A7J5XLH0_DISMA|nr:hypothetical protein F7725_009700 [Dissostichus mawsoni]